MGHVPRSSTSESADKPDSVEDDHPSAIVVTNDLMRPTRRLPLVAATGRHLRGPEGPLGLAPSGVYLATDVTTDAGGLLHHRFTLTATKIAAVYFLLHFPVGHPRWTLSTTLALWSPDFPQRTRCDHLADSLVARRVRLM